MSKLSHLPSCVGCPLCPGTAKLEFEVREMEIKGVGRRIAVLFYKCENCGEEFDTEDSLDTALSQARDQTKRPTERISETLAQIEDIWRKHPDLRLMQLLTIAITTEKQLGQIPTIFHLEDDVLMRMLKRVAGK